MLPARYRLLAGHGIKSQGNLRAATVVNPHHRSVSIYRNAASCKSDSSHHLLPVERAQRRAIFTTCPNLQSKVDEMAEPTGLIAKSGIELLTFGELAHLLMLRQTDATDTEYQAPRTGSKPPFFWKSSRKSTGRSTPTNPSTSARTSKRSPGTRRSTPTGASRLLSTTTAMASPSSKGWLS